MSNNFVENFVNESIELGFSKPKDIAARASSRMDEIDEQIKNLTSLQSERNNLNKVLKSFNIEPKARINSKKAKVLVQQESIADEDAISEYQNMILDLFKNGDDVVLSTKQIAESIIGPGKDMSPVYLILQKMQMEKILVRGEDRMFSLL
jgi:hypothetical protein